MDTGSHECCFCSMSTGGLPMCCRCGATLPAKLINYEAFMTEQQYKHSIRKEADSASDTE